MDRRPYDIPLEKPDAPKKRTRNDISFDEQNFNIPPATPMISPENQSQPAAGTHIREPILTTEYANVDFPSDASKSSEEDKPRHKMSRSNAANDIADSGVPDVATRSNSNSASLKDTASSYSNGDKIDEYKIKLGVGWEAPDTTQDHVAAALRGHQNYVQKSFPLCHVKIVAQCNSHHCCLVESAQGWFFFDDDLQTGRMLAKDKETALSNLAKQPTVFEKDEPVLRSGENMSSSSEGDMIVGEMELD
ncbi:MAG: hypothetical protein OHK93_006800 [Ramalina farinacea]|uniref:Uncharacterized protein n=1 Tax=Ramalina farinacea TaxID=258253 RepID=A0AA43TUX2_9LECA|nr:hypothetical protein [Ramalina farinacea]